MTILLPSNIIPHPEWYLCQEEMHKHRLVYTGGTSFRDYYLKRFGSREEPEDFEYRRGVTYIPTPAKAAVNEIANSIIERLSDVERTAGPESYQQAIQQGIDGHGRSLNGFLATEIIGELLAMGRVGVYIDRDDLGEEPSLLESRALRPYIYAYRRENILNWAYDSRNRLIGLLLREAIEDLDQSGMVTKMNARYRRLTKVSDGVKVEIINSTGEIIETDILRLDFIPFVMFQLPMSLLTDIADHQIAILNLGSTDIVYGLRSNFPFYTEQYDPSAEAANRLLNDQTTEDRDPKKTADTSAAIGITRGRRFSKGMERPGFIHPSPEPLFASMEKQAQLKVEIRELLNRTLAAIEASKVSAYTIKEERSDRDRGLSAIGMELENGENKIAQIWANYEAESTATVRYPKAFNLRSESERKAEAEQILKLCDKIPSITAQRELKKQVTKLLLEANVPKAVMDQIEDEINRTTVATIDPDTIRQDHEAGFVGSEMASELRGYPKGEVEKAKKDHAERLARIAKAQSENSAPMGPRGVPDQSPTPRTEAIKEKQQ